MATDGTAQGPAAPEDLYGDYWTDLPGPRDISTYDSIATDPLDQLSWYEENVWAFCQFGHLPPDPQQYGPNTIAANVRASLDVNCSMLQNVPSASPEAVANAPTDMTVNIAQAITCEYPGNMMQVTAMIPAEAFGFNKGSLELVGNGTQAEWGAGYTEGFLNLTVYNIGDMAQLVVGTPLTCCITYPNLDCSGAAGFPSYYDYNETALIQSGDSATLQFYVVSNKHGDGYCEVAVSSLYHGVPSNINVFSFVEQISWSAPIGPPIYFAVDFTLFWPNIERSFYFANGGYFTSNESGWNAFTLG